MLKKELGIFTFNDLLEHFPNRHIDKTKINLIKEITPQTEYIQVAGKLLSAAIAGENRSRRLVAALRDSSGMIEMVWFQGIHRVQKMLRVGMNTLFMAEQVFFRAHRN